MSVDANEPREKELKNRRPVLLDPCCRPPLSAHRPPPTANRLALLARRTGRTKTFYAREAILQHLGDLEDIYLATKRLERPVPTYSAAEVKHELGL